MLQANIRKVIWLNFTIATTLGLYGVFLLWHISQNAHASPLNWLFLLASALYTFVVVSFVLLNVLLLRLLRRADGFFVEKLGVIIPAITAGCLQLLFLLSNQLGVACLGVLPVFQAALLGHTHFAKGIFITALVIFCVNSVFRLPLPFADSSLDSPALFAVVICGLMLSLMQFATMVGAVVNSGMLQVEKLQSLATTDGLTGLLNRRQFNMRLRSEVARAARHKHALSLALFDIDNFKKINDVYGHPVGDRILIELGTLVAGNVRESDIPARYGGEEFALILPETALYEAYDMMERLRKLIAQHPFCKPEHPMQVTVSVGVARLDIQRPSGFELVEKADAALYDAKRNGKNQVVYGVLPPEKLSPTLQNTTNVPPAAVPRQGNMP